MGKTKKSLSSLKDDLKKIPKEKMDKLKGGKDTKIKRWGRNNSCGNIVPQ